MEGWSSVGVRRVRALVVGLCLALVFIAVPGAASGQNPPPILPGEATLPPLQIMVLVDESGSLSPEAVVEEKKAARTIALSVLAPGSEVSVAGFGSSNAEGQTAVEVYCPPTVLDSQQKRDALASCIGQLHRREPGEGNGTDHAAALEQASKFASTGPEKKVVFLLTDGKLDVSESPQYGDTVARRNAAAAAAVEAALSGLDAEKAQVWPLGFGIVDEGALAGFARGQSCANGVLDPRARVVPLPELTAAVTEAFSSASCVIYDTTDPERLPAPGSVDLQVTIPAVASDAAILVYKKDARVQVEYVSPDASSPAPAAGGSNFEFAGQNTETESLRIADPEPGVWTVRLSSSDVAAENVQATVAYQAAVKASLTASPPQPVAGQPVDVEMYVWARGETIKDEGLLKDLSFVSRLVGGSIVPGQTVELTDPEGDGSYTGRFTVPDGASGGVTFTGTVSGLGIGGDTRVLNTRIQDAVSAVSGQILFDSNQAEVTPGSTVSGNVSVTNNSGVAVPLRLQLAELTPGTTLTVDPPTAEAGPGGSSTPFTLRVDPAAVPGGQSATLQIVDALSQNVVAERVFATQVVPEPSILQTLWWLWLLIGLILLALLVVLILQWRARQAAVQVGGLRAQLFQADFLTFELEPRNARDKVFRFVLHNDFTGPQLQPAGPDDDGVFEMRRTSAGVSLVTPSNPAAVVLRAGERREVGPNLAIGVVDEKGVRSAPPNDPTAVFQPDPFAGSAAPATGGSSLADSSSYPDYSDPLADRPSPSAPTATYPTSNQWSTDADRADPFDSTPADEPRRRRDTSPPPGSGAVDPYDPFG